MVLLVGGRRYGDLCSDIAENFNGWIRGKRENHIVSMVEEIKVKLMEQIYVHGEECTTLFKWK